MQENVQDQVKRLEEARKKAQDLATEKSRLEGELGSLQKQKAELETRCKKEFECSVEDLPSLIDNFKKEAEDSLVQAEVILGIREGKVENTAAKATVKRVVVKAPIAAQDDDGLV